jgi:hypothetical protein
MWKRLLKWLGETLLRAAVDKAADKIKPKQ